MSICDSDKIERTDIYFASGPNIALLIVFLSRVAKHFPHPAE